MKSKLTKNQTKTLEVPASKQGRADIHTVTIRYDDRCGNGHNSFSITAEGRDMGGCCHKEVVAAFPHLAKFIKWHSTSSGGPMHYISNTVYHASARDCWGGKKGDVRWTEFGLKGKNGLPVVDKNGKAVAWKKEDEAQTVAAQMGAEVVEVPWRFHEGKERDLDAARSCAVWPEATDAQLMAEPEELRKMLEARHGELMESFRADMIELGFEY
jgi:hypothetical protein